MRSASRSAFLKINGEKIILFRTLESDWNDLEKFLFYTILFIQSLNNLIKTYVSAGRTSQFVMLTLGKISIVMKTEEALQYPEVKPFAPEYRILSCPSITLEE